MLRLVGAEKKINGWRNDIHVYLYVWSLQQTVVSAGCWLSVEFLTNTFFAAFTSHSLKRLLGEQEASDQIRSDWELNHGRSGRWIGSQTLYQLNYRGLRFKILKKRIFPLFHNACIVNVV